MNDQQQRTKETDLSKDGQKLWADIVSLSRTASSLIFGLINERDRLIEQLEIATKALNRVDELCGGELYAVQARAALARMRSLQQ